MSSVPDKTLKIVDMGCTETVINPAYVRWCEERIKQLADEKESLRSANIRLRNTVSKLQAAQENKR